MFYVLLATRAALRRARPFRRPARAQSRRRCSTSSRSAPSPTSCASTRSTGRSSRKGSRASAPAARNPASSRCSPSRAAIRAGRRPTTWASSPVRASMPPGGSPTCRSASAASLADTEAAAAPLAAELDRLNRERRDVEATMQDEALAALEARALDAADDRCLHALPVPPRLAPGRRRHRRRPAQGPVPPPGDRVRPGDGRRAQGLRPLDRRLPSARRARPRDQARAGTAREFGGHAFAAGLTHRRIRPAALRRDLRGHRPRAADAGRPRAHARSGRRARAGRARDRPGQRPARRVWGQGFPAPLFDDIFSVLAQRIVGGKHSKLVARPRRRTVRRDPVSVRRSASAVDPRGLSPGRQRMARRGIAATRHRALAASLASASRRTVAGATSVGAIRRVPAALALLVRNILIIDVVIDTSIACNHRRLCNASNRL